MMRLALALLGTLGLAGCVPDYLTRDDSEVIISIWAINGAATLHSDVRADDGTVTSDEVTVSWGVRHKNLRQEAPMIPQWVLLERYEVSYFRSDGRAVEGEDVPYRITGALTTGENVETSGGAEFLLEIVRAQAKLEPPLMNLRAGGGAIVLTVFANVTLHGRTWSGQAVTTSGRLQIDFADWGG